MAASLTSVILVFGMLGGLLWMLRRWGSAPLRGRHIEVAETVPIAAGKSLSVVKVGGRVLLLATTNEGVTLLTELDPNELERPREDLTAKPQVPLLLSPRRWIGRATASVSRST